MQPVTTTLVILRGTKGPIAIVLGQQCGKSSLGKTNRGRRQGNEIGRLEHILLRGFQGPLSLPSSVWLSSCFIKPIHRVSQVRI